MSHFEKPNISMQQLNKILEEHFHNKADTILPIETGNISTVFSFNISGKGYVIKFSNLINETDYYVSQLLSKQDTFAFPKILGIFNSNNLNYSIEERLDGKNLSEFSSVEQQSQFPQIFSIISTFSALDITESTGYGFIQSDGNALFSSWNHFVQSVFDENQDGTFWENWTSLFKTSFLDKGLFNEMYARLLSYTHIVEPYRYFVQGDFHQWNILSNGHSITGIVDGNFLYGDFLIDLAVLDRHMSWNHVIDNYKYYIDKNQINIPYFEQRLKAAYYFKELDGLRFCAKMGWEESYQTNRAFLLQLDK